MAPETLAFEIYRFSGEDEEHPAPGPVGGGRMGRAAAAASLEGSALSRYYLAQGICSAEDWAACERHFAAPLPVTFRAGPEGAAAARAAGLECAEVFPGAHALRGPLPPGAEVGAAAETDKQTHRWSRRTATAARGGHLRVPGQISAVSTPIEAKYVAFFKVVG